MEMSTIESARVENDKVVFKTAQRYSIDITD